MLFFFLINAFFSKIYTFQNSIQHQNKKKNVCIYAFYYFETSYNIYETTARNFSWKICNIILK